MQLKRILALEYHHRKRKPFLLSTKRKKLFSNCIHYYYFLSFLYEYLFQHDLGSKHIITIYWWRYLTIRLMIKVLLFAFATYYIELNRHVNFNEKSIHIYIMGIWYACMLNVYLNEPAIINSTRMVSSYMVNIIDF